MKTGILRYAAFRYAAAFFALAALLPLASCEKTTTTKNENTDELAGTKKYLYSIMSSIYYWSDDIQSVTAGDYTEMEDYFDALLSKKDRWSWMETGAEYNSSETGQYLAYGGRFCQPYEYYGDYDIYMGFVYEGSPLANQGVTRGWQLLKLNGTDVAELVKGGTFNSTLDNSSNTFTYKDLDGNTNTFTISKGEIQAKSVVKSAVYTNAEFAGLSAGQKVGYMFYVSFNSSMQNEITQTIKSFKDEGITDLIVDLRYNGGGDLSVCSNFADLLAPASADNKVFLKLKHNSKYSSYDELSSSKYIIARSTNSLNLSRVFFITGEGTASASESLMNGLKPFTEVKIVGDTTYGKPNGMYVYEYPENVSIPDYVFLPICFYCVNSNGGGYFDDGIVPDNYRFDDLYHDFGVKEDLISACLTYIATGSYPAAPSKKSGASGATKNGKSIGKKIRMPEDAEGYGLALLKRPE